MKVTKEMRKAFKNGKDLIVKNFQGYSELQVKLSETITFKTDEKSTSSTLDGTFIEMYVKEDVLATLYHLTKVDDELNFTMRTNNNNYITDAGLFNDELCITLIRKEKVIIKSMVIAASVCPDNSARSIMTF